MIRCGDKGNRYRDNRRDNGSDGWNKKQEKCSSKRQETMKSTHPGAFYVCASMELIIFKVVI